MKITNLEELRKSADENTVSSIVTEYMMEKIAKAHIYDAFEQKLNDKNDNDKMTVSEIKDMLDDSNIKSDFIV